MDAGLGFGGLEVRGEPLDATSKPEVAPPLPYTRGMEPGFGVLDFGLGFRGYSTRFFVFGVKGTGRLLRIYVRWFRIHGLWCMAYG